MDGELLPGDLPLRQEGELWLRGIGCEHRAMLCQSHRQDESLLESEAFFLLHDDSPPASCFFTRLLPAGGFFSS